jgi:phage repressor protein C with HTH and peptisase S24 domain
MEIERFHGVSAARPEARDGVERGRVPVPASSSRRFAAVVDGDCMEPKFRDGDVVVFSVDAAEKEGIVEGRNYFLQFIDGENTFKRIFFDPDNAEQLVLRCWNAHYPHRCIRRDRIQLLARAEFRLVPDEPESEQGNG